VSDWTVGVELSGTGNTVAIDIGDTEFDRLFNLCPVVKYTRNLGVHSVYVREAGRPQVDAFSLFTYRWANQDNILNTDFKIYDSEAAARSGTGAWTFCNYNDADVGYPRDCGRNGNQHNHWFSMPADGQHDANSGGGSQRFDIRNIHAGASFEVYTGSDCPVAQHASPTLRNGNLEEGFSTAIFEYTNTIAGWAASGGTVSCRSGNAPWGGITSSEGNYYVALQSRGAAIQQAVDGHVTGHSYTLRVSAAQRQNSPGGRGAILKITVGGVELLNEQITSASFVQREVTYTATQSTEVIRFENTVGAGDQTIFVDDIQIDA